MSPRGGRRPGAGAPKGNANAMRGSNSSLRAWLVYYAMHLHPDPRAVALELHRAGLIAYDRPIDKKCTFAAIAHLYNLWFDSPLRDNQTEPVDWLAALADGPDLTRSANSLPPPQRFPMPKPPRPRQPRRAQKGNA